MEEKAGPGEGAVHAIMAGSDSLGFQEKLTTIVGTE
jgi:hypothetical protein